MICRRKQDFHLEKSVLTALERLRVQKEREINDVIYPIGLHFLDALYMKALPAVWSPCL